MNNRKIRFGPTAIPTSATNMINTTITSLAGPVGFTATQPKAIIKHIRVINKDTVARTVSMYIGATGGSAAGTEFLGTAISVPANSYIEWYGELELLSADFLTALASAVTTLVFVAEGDIGF